MAFLDHEGGAEFPYARDDVFSALLQTVPTIPGMKVETEDRLAGRILVKAGVSLWSWGENIPISIAEISPGRTRVSIVSTPKTGVLLGGAFDLGKNRKNIERILGSLSRVLGKLPRAPQPGLSADRRTSQERLVELGNLRDKGLITQGEYEKRKGEILSEL